MERTQVAAGPLRELMAALAAPPRRPPEQPVVVGVDVLAALGRLSPAVAVFYNDLAPQRRPRGAAPATTLPDATLRAWRRSPRYLGHVRADIPVDRELLLPLPGPPGHARRIRLVREGGRDFDATDRALAALVRPHLVAHLHALDLAGRGVPQLTARQRQLLELVAEGFSNLQAARTLGISAHTVRTHLHQIYARLGVTSRGEAAALLRPSW
jgi:DNA-binding CsgD family transcriptional regulator